MLKLESPSHIHEKYDLDILFFIYARARKSVRYELQTSAFCGVDQNKYQKVLHLVYNVKSSGLVRIYVAFPAAVYLTV